MSLLSRPKENIYILTFLKLIAVIYLETDFRILIRKLYILKDLQLAI
jgi:hypothetical protein